MTNSTISGNNVGPGANGQGYGAGIYVGGGTAIINNSIVSGNNGAGDAYGS